MADLFEGMNYVYEVYRTRSFSRAAQSLFISQPALSAYIKKIETRLGMPLFDRSTSPIGMTECGEKYIEAARQVMHIESDFLDYLNDMKNITTGSIRIGAGTFYASALLPKVIMDFSSSYPQVEIYLKEGRVHELEEQLTTGELDFVIEANAFDDKVFEHPRIYHEHLVLVVPAGFCSNEQAASSRITREDIVCRRHVGSATRSVDLHTFARDPFILLQEENDVRIRADRIFKEVRFRPEILLTLDHQMTAFNMCMQGMGATIVSDTLILSMPPAEGVCFYKLENQSVHRDVFLYYKKNKYLTPVMEAFLETALTDFLPNKER